MLKIARKKKFIAAIVASFVGAFILLQPYFTSRRIRTAFIEGDATALTEHVDFSAMRSNLKARLNASYEEPKKRDQLGSMVNLGHAVILSQIESNLTPEGLHLFVNRVDGSGVERSVQERRDAFQHSAWHTYQSPNRFTTTMTFQDEFSVQLMLHRDGFEWKLCDIAFATL